MSLSACVAWFARTLGAELGCEPELLFAPGVHVLSMGRREGDPLVRGFPWREAACHVISGGTGAVVASTPVVAERIAALYDDCRDRDGAFAAPRLAGIDAALRPHGTGFLGPTVRLVCGSDSWVESRAPAGVELEIEADPGPERQHELGTDSAWGHSVTGRVREARPMRAIALARRAGELIGVASISQDSDRMWQIGIDVRGSERGSGVGAALASRLARLALERGRVPYWGANSANIPSIRTAQRAGFRLVFTEYLSYPLPEGPLPPPPEGR